MTEISLKIKKETGRQTCRTLEISNIPARNRNNC